MFGAQYSEQKVILAMSWGRRFSSPGLVNEAIARRIVQHVGNSRNDIIIIAQCEVADALSALGVKCDHVVEQKGIYISSKYVLAKMSEYLRDHGFYNQFQVMLAGHPLHLRRCKRILRRLKVPVFKTSTISCDEIFDDKDIHPWVWNKDIYKRYECLLRWVNKTLRS